MKSIDEFRNKIIRGDARFVLKEIPDGSVDCILTSPPYYALRDYGEDATAIWNGDPMCEHEWILLDAHSPPLSLNKDRMWKVCTKCNATKGQLGLEPTPELYINHLMQVFAEVKRVLKKMGTCWVNIGDTYCGGGHGGNTLYKTKNGKLVKSLKYGEGSNYVPVIRWSYYKYQPKCMLMIPERFALAMVNDGWILRNKICWYRPNHMPSSVRDRFANSWEHIYFFTKARKYWFDLDAVREEPKFLEVWSRKGSSKGTPYETNNPRSRWGLTKHEIATMRKGSYTDPLHEKPYNIKGKNPGDTWAERQKSLTDHFRRKDSGGHFDYGGLDSKEGKHYHPHGKNPGDVTHLSPKYLKGEGHTNRQGLNRFLDTVTIKAYKEYQKPIAEFLRDHIKPMHKPILDNIFGKHKWRHWIRTDLSGAALPGVADWWELKEILGFGDNFDDKIYEVEKLNIPIFQSGHNPGNFWEINTKAFPDSHFAVFPEELCVKPIKAGCPAEVCVSCGKPRQIIRSGGNPNAFNIRVRDVQKGKFKSFDRVASEEEILNYDEKSYNPPEKVKIIDCGCNAGYEPGIVLDPFAGSGTVGVVAKKLGRDYILIDISQKYCEMARKRITVLPVKLGRWVK